MFVQVTFPISSFQTFTYSVPLKLQKRVHIGSCVNASMGKRLLTGFVVSVNEKSSFSGKIKNISNIQEDRFNISKELWKTLEWMSKYYITPLGQVLKTAIPHSFITPYSPKKIKFVSITTMGNTIIRTL